jgi:hypothetical protein
MNKEFVPYKESLDLKELGFDEPCFGFYKLDNIDVYYDTILQGNKHKFRSNTELNFYGDLKEKISAPTFSQAFRWFREKYGVKFHIREDIWNHWCYLNILSSEEYVIMGEYKSYEEAELECLRKLIEITKR